MRISISFSIALVLLCASCSKGKTVKSESYFDFKTYFSEQIAKLKKLNPGFKKTVSINGEPGVENEDSLNWEKELALFASLDINNPVLQGKYMTDMDSSGRISIQTYTAMDTGLNISSISVTRVDKEIQLVEAKLRKRSFVVDRDVLLSYQPLKGYGIRINENYIWGSPVTKEIFTELEVADFLKN